MCSAYKMYKSDTHIAKCADYVILSPMRSKIKILIIEMKRTNCNRKHMQMIGAKCFIEYCFSLMNKLHINRRNFRRDLIYKFVAFTHANKTLNKRPTENYRSGDSPNEYITITYAKKYNYRFLC